MCGRGRVLAEPRLSPDGHWVAFVATADGRGALVVVAAGGGPEVVVTSDPPPPPTASYGGGTFDWTPSGDALVYVGADRGLYHQPVAGGPPRLVVGDGPVAAPAVSPDGTPGGLCARRPPRGGGGTGRRAVPGRCGCSARPDFAFDPAWSPDGRWIAWHEWDVPPWPGTTAASWSRPADGSGRGRSRWCSRRRRLPSASPGSAPTARPGFPLRRRRLAEHVAGRPRRQPAQALLSRDGRARRAHLGARAAQLRLVARWPAGGVRAATRGASAACAWPGSGRRRRRRASTGVSTAPCRWAGGRICGLRSGGRTPDQIVVLDPDAPAEEPSRRHTVARGPVAGFEAAGLVEPELVTWEGEAISRVWARPSTAASTGAGPAPTSRPGPLLVWIHGGPTGQAPGDLQRPGRLLL